MKTFTSTLYFGLILIGLLLGCRKETDIEEIKEGDKPPVDTVPGIDSIPVTIDSVLNISGYILDYLSNPAEGILVTLDNVSGSTDHTGFFKFDSLQKGTHILSVNNDMANPDVTSFTQTIELSTKSVSLDSLILLQALVLNEPIDLQPSSITLTWTNNNPDEGNFLEYRVYLGGTYYANTLNEENGILVYIGTNIHDTLYTINEENYENAGGTITPESEYYFRVYAHNNREIISASNILEVVTPPRDTTNLLLHYELEPVISFAGAAPIKGIDWDNNGNLWLFYFEELGYNNGNIIADGKLVNFNYNTGQCLDTIAIDGFTEVPSGIAFDNDLIWVQMKRHQGKLNAYDIESGNFVKTFMLSGNQHPLSDIAKTEDGFIILWHYHMYQLINELGGVIISGETPNMMYHAEEWDLGISFRPGEYWLIGTDTRFISIMDEEGTLLGIVNTNLTMNLGWGSDCRMAIKGNKLAIATLSHVYIYDIVIP